jgi:hypothetical protein
MRGKPISLLFPYHFLNDRTYAVEGFGEAMPPRNLYFLVILAGFAGKYHQK